MGHRPIPHRRRPPRRSDSRWSSVLFIGLLLIAALGSGAAVFVATAMPADFVRDQIIAQVRARTGRELVIAGPTSVTVFPSLGISMGDVTLSAPPGMEGEPLVRMEGLDAAVRLLPLFNREVAVEQLVLRRPVFELTIDVDGRKSWEFAALGGAPARARPVGLAEVGGRSTDAGGDLPADAREFRDNSSAGAAGGGQGMARLSQLALDDVRIENGTIRYSDKRSDVAYEATAVDVRLGLSTFDSPLTAAGKLTWRSEPIAFDARLSTVRLLMERRPTRLALALSGRPAEASYSGSLTVADGLDAEGAVTAKAASLRALARWLGAELPPARGYGPLDLSGQLRLAGTTATLGAASLSLDGATARGELNLTSGGARPVLSANLQISELDLNAYMSTGESTGEPAPDAAPPADEPDGPSAGGAPQSIDDLLDAPAPGARVKAYQRREGWSEEAIDLSALGLLDAEAKLSIGRLLIREIKIGQSQVSVTLNNRIAKATFAEVQLYEGKGRGFVTVDSTAPRTPSIGANIAVEGVAALPLLKDAAAQDWLAGTGRLTLAVAGQGSSERAIVETLNGKADFAFTDGAIVGINIAKILRGLGQGRIGGIESTPDERTDFSEFSASWTIANGTAQNQDLRLVSPLLRVAGGGAVMLPQRTIDYTLRPKLVASLAGQGGEEKVSGLEIPVRITGGWDKPDIAADLDSVLENPDQAVEAVKEIGKQFKGKNAEEIMKGLFGDDDETGSDGKKQKGLLEQFLKQ